MVRPAVLGLLSMLSALAASPQQVQATEFPYLATVRTEAAVVRSGPGEAFYPTGVVRQGEQLEVYREVRNEWLAIRPTPASFSYVRVDQVQATSDPTILEVIVDRVKTRVGSETSDAKHVEYVTLRRGEKLHALGPPIPVGNDGTRWYRIAPPSGEFRWVHRSDVVPTSADELPGATHRDATEMAPPPPPTDSSPDLLNPVVSEALPLSQANPAGKPLAATTDAEREATTDPATPVASDAAATNGEEPIPLEKLTQRMRMKTEPIDAGVPDAPSTPTSSKAEMLDESVVSDEPKSPVSRDALQAPERRGARQVVQATHSPAATEDTGVELAGHESPTADAAHNDRVTLASHSADAVDARPAAAASPRSAPVDQGSAWSTATPEPPAPPYAELVDRQHGEITQLELELSRIVSREMGEWDMSDLRARLIALRRASAEPRVLQQVDHLLRRTDEFADLQRRHAALLSSQLEPIAPEISLASAPVPQPQAMLANGQQPIDVASAQRPPRPPRRADVARPAPQGVSTGVANPYTSQGWLVPVLTARRDLPRFAITDDQGRIRHFVTPAPGLNLNRYVRQQVGIVGQPLRAARADQPAGVMAERVVVLQRQRR